MQTKLTRSLAFRLTVLYATVCSLSLLLILTASYFILKGILERRLDGHLLNEVEEYGLLLHSQNVDVLRDVLRRETESEGTQSMFFRVLTPAGEELIATDLTSWPDVRSKAVPLPAPGEGKFTTVQLEGEAFARRIYSGWITPDLIFQVGESTRENAELLWQFRKIFTAAMAAFIICSLAVGALMARRALAGITLVTRTAQQIILGDWESRVPISRSNDEIDELSRTFNTMVDRINVLIRELREVTDDIAHDLRTPLTRLRAAAESDLHNGALTEAHHEAASAQVEECDRMLALINMMLEISHTESGLNTLSLQPCNVPPLILETVELFLPSAEDKGVSLSASGATNMLVLADESSLKRALGHIVDNAVKYTPPKGQITVQARYAGSVGVISVEDTGPGIPVAVQENIFSRFFRADVSRTDSGNGLGLSLARAICRAHEGDLIVHSQPGKGATFEIRLPLSEQSEW